MARVKKEEFSVGDIGVNPYVINIQIPVVNVVSDDTYQSDDGILVNSKRMLEATPFTKLFVYSKSRVRLMGLSPRASKVLLWVMCEIDAGKDYLWINKDRLMKESGISSVNTYKSAVAELWKSGYIFPAAVKDVYWINPGFFFRGNRVSKYKDKVVVVKSME